MRSGRRVIPIIIAQRMRKRNLLLGTASGLLLAVSMPKPGWWPAAWIGLVPLLIALKSARTRNAMLCGLVAGLVYYGAICSWLTIFGYLPWFLVALKEAAWLMLFAAAAALMMPDRTGPSGYLTVPAVWTFLQWARVIGPLGFTWGSLAHTQANVLPVAQISSVTGPWGIDFLVCLVNVALADIVTSPLDYERKQPGPPRLLRWKQGLSRRWFAAGVSFAAAAAVCAGGYLAQRREPTRAACVRVAVIQGSLPHEVNPGPEYVPAAFAAYEQMSRRAARSKPDLVVWPETTIVDEITDTRWGPQLSELARETAANYIVGGYDASGDPEGRNYNSAHLFDRTGRRIGVYHKVHLVPYGEYVPFRDQMPWLERYDIRDVDVLPGTSHDPIATDVGKIGVSICFESLFPAVSAQETRRGANALVIITNDAWFKRTQAARQHLMMARLRAIENRRYVVRAAATGISAIIDPQGHVLCELPIYRRGILRARIAPLDGLTLYARFGDWFVFLCAAAVSCSAAVRRRLGKRT